MCTGASDPHSECGDSTRHSHSAASHIDGPDACDRGRCRPSSFSRCPHSRHGAVLSARIAVAEATGGGCRPSVDCRSGSVAAAAAETSASDRASCAQPCTPLLTNQLAALRHSARRTACSGTETREQTQRRPSPLWQPNSSLQQSTTTNHEREERSEHIQTYKHANLQSPIFIATSRCAMKSQLKFKNSDARPMVGLLDHSRNAM